MDKKFTLKYIRVLQNLKRSGHKPAHVIEQPSDQESTAESEDEEHQALLNQLMETEDAQEQIEILAVMRTRGFKPPTRGQGGQRRPFVPRAGGAAKLQIMPPAAAPTSPVSTADARAMQQGSAGSPKRSGTKGPASTAVSLGTSPEIARRRLRAPRPMSGWLSRLLSPLCARTLG